MIRINQLKLSIDYTEAQLVSAICNAMRIKPSDIKSYTVIKRSLDSRNKQLKYVLSAAVELKREDAYLAKNKRPKHTLFRLAQ